MVSRRGFFKLLGGIAASPVLKPLAKLLPEPKTYSTYIYGKNAVIGQYADFIKFYDKAMLDNLKANTPFLAMSKQMPLPERTGNQIQFFTNCSGEKE